jgi:hypothetical protein
MCAERERVCVCVLREREVNVKKRECVYVCYVEAGQGQQPVRARVTVETKRIR